MNVVTLDASGDDPVRTIDAGVALDRRIPGESEEELLRENPILRAMGEIASEFSVSVTLSVYPTRVGDEDAEDVEDDGGTDAVDDVADAERVEP